MPAPAAVGRDAELAIVDEFLARLPHAGGVLSIEGESGIGKTTIWQQAVGRAHRAGIRVLACRPAALEVRLSFAGLSDMLGGLGPEVLERLPALQRTALEVALLRAAPEGPSLDPRLVGTALLALLRTLAASSRVLLAVDDAQWLDAPTGGVLAFAIRRLEREPVGMVCAFRPYEPILARLAPIEPERVTRLRLGPLHRDPLRRLVAERLPGQLPLPVLSRIAEASGGNPFYALEMARLLPDGEPIADPARLPVPEDVRALAQSRVAALSEPARAALLWTAVLAAPSAELVDADALAPAEEVGLVRIDPRGRIEFTHPLFAAAIYSSASAAERRRAHRAAAGAVPDPEERARHLAYATTRPDPGVAAELDTAAELACSRGALDSAAELVELALRQTPPDARDDRPRRLLQAAVLHWDGGNSDRAEELLSDLLAGPAPDPLPALALRLRATLQCHTVSFSAALQTATEALARAGDPATAAAIELDIAFYLLGLGDLAAGLRHAEAVADRAEGPGGDPGVLGDALAVATMIAFLSGHGLSEERLARALALEQPARQRALFTSPRYVAGLLAIWTGRLREGARILEELRAERAERGIAGDVPGFSLYLARAYLGLGEIDRAREVVAADITAGRLLGNRWQSALALSASALVCAHRGELETARSEAELALEHLTQLQWWTQTQWPRWALGFAELSAGRPAAAHAALAPLAEALPATGPVDPVWLVFLPDEIEALIALGEPARAASLTERLDRMGRAFDRPAATAAAARCRGLLAAATGALEDAITAFEEALAEHDRTEMPLERARTLLALGRVRRRRKQWRAAREALREAAATFESAGVARWAAAAREELARAGDHPADPTELTPTERRVAELAAAGLTNQEVAERAFLTVKGVEGNLTRAYRKLGIRSRSGLARALEGGDEPIAPA